MGAVPARLTGPDLAAGVELSSIPESGMLLGHARGEPVLLVRRGHEMFAIGAICTHYGAPLVEGLLVGDTVRCPWHHACFSLRTGAALRAPALDPVSRWRVEEVRDAARQFMPVDQPVGAVYVREKLEDLAPEPLPATAGMPAAVVIVGGGGAGNAAAEMLRREGFAGHLTMLSADTSVPYDRPKLSKGFLSGKSEESANPLRSSEFYQKHKIDLKLNVRVTAIDTKAHEVRLDDGSRHGYDALLLAPGAEPVRLDISGADLPHVHYLRTVADSRAIVVKAKTSRRAVVIGASFIGLEVAASLRTRGIGVDVVAPDKIPMERILGAEVGNFFRKLHEDHGVTFHLETTATSIDERSVTLKNGNRLEADLVVVGIGVKPALALAEQAGLATDRGITVDTYLQTSAPNVYAAGDIARWPDRLTGEAIRVEHWVVAERQGQTAAHNILGRRERFDCAPFFWTIQYDFGLGYVGHAEKWDKADIAGSLEARDCTISYSRDGRRLAMGIVNRNLDGLRAEVEFESLMAADTGGNRWAAG